MSSASAPSRLGGVVCCSAVLFFLWPGTEQPRQTTQPPLLESTSVLQSQRESPKPPKVNPDGYTSARVCGGCHTDIYNSWKKSMHAFSLSDPIFDTSFMQSLKEAGEVARQRCLHCHAPMTMMNGDYELAQGVSREGVSCDFCHTVTDVHLDGRPKPYSLEPGLVKRGVIKYAASPAHQVAYSELHGKSEFCGGCHNLTTAEGVAVLSTFDEWKNGPYALDGVQCQNCHMVLSPGQVVSGVAPSKAKGFHLHSLIRDSDQLRSALSVEITGARRDRDSVEVDVRIENVGSGHMVPTGIPSREVVLEVTATSGGHTRSAERRYRKVVADRRGRPLQSDHEAILKGVRILTDNRIGPREARHERFRFSVRAQGPVNVSARLFYHYSPPILKVQRMKIEMGKVEKSVH